MAIVVWDGSLNIGIEAIDKQHEELFNTINNLHDKICRGDDKMFLLATLDTLKHYIRFHLRTEESLMKRYGFPETDDHSRQHDLFRDKIESLEGMEDTDITSLLREALSFLLGWLVDHIMSRDALLGKFLKKQGI